MPHAGIDLATCPPLNAMQWLWDHTNLKWIAFYLPVSGPGLKDKLTWRKKFAALRNIGWGVAPIYVGKQRNSAKLKARAGKERLEGFLDGVEACKFAHEEGIPLNTVIYFDYEGGDVPTKAWKTYFAGWVEAVSAQLYYPGWYISHAVGKPQLFDEIASASGTSGLVRRPEIWGINIGVVKKNKAVFDTTKPGAPVRFPENHPVGCGIAEASNWQHSGLCTLVWMDDTNPKLPVKRKIFPVDLDTSIYQDPGMATL